MLTYTSCATLFDKARNPEAGKPIGPNTRIMRRGDSYALRFHATDILTFMPSGAVRYDTGGWRTVTTKERMNKYGLACVYSDRGIWHINPRTSGSTWTGGAPYVDGCIVHRGKVKGAGKARDVTRERKLRASIGKFARDYVAKLYAGEIAAPDSGDCWGCLMRADDGSRPMAGKGASSCIVGHVQEAYHVPSLIWRALEAANAGDAYKREAAGLQNMPGKPADWRPMAGFVREQLTRMLRRYCMRECGLAA
jgi:hypothetical protein